MPLSDPRIVFGIHNITPYSRTTGLPYGILKVLGDVTMSLKADSVDLHGGGNKFPYASEVTKIDPSLNFSCKSLEDFVMELFMGASVSKTAASSNGTISAISNFKGTSVMSATTGVATATMKAGESGELKIGKFMIKAVSATTVDVYAMSDLNFKSKGDDLSFQDDYLKITASPLTITASTAVEIPNSGIELTGGSGVIGMTEDDTAYFYVTPPHAGLSEISFGQDGLTFPEHGVYIVAQERSSGDMFEIEIFKAKSSAGMVIPLSEGGYSISDMSLKLLYDSTKEKVGIIRASKGE